MYASPTERSPPIWKKPPKGLLGSAQKLQVITRAQQQPVTQDSLSQKNKRFQKRREKTEKRNNNLKNTNIGKRRGGGYDVKVFDARNKQSSYSIKDGFIDTENFPTYLLEDTNINNNNNNNNRRHKGVLRHHSNGKLSSSRSSVNPTLTTAFRRRHLGNGRSRSATIATKQFNQKHFQNLDLNTQSDVPNIIPIRW